MEGTASRIIDGDTFILGKYKIRICGVNAPELNKKGGKEARGFMKGLLWRQKIKCVIVGGGTPCDERSGRESYDRIVTQCFVENGDVAEALVEAGYAVDSPKYSGGYYD